MLNVTYYIFVRITILFHVGMVLGSHRTSVFLKVFKKKKKNPRHKRGRKFQGHREQTAIEGKKGN